MRPDLRSFLDLFYLVSSRPTTATERVPRWWIGEMVGGSALQSSRLGPRGPRTISGVVQEESVLGD